MLHYLALYNSDSGLIFLQLLPMKWRADIDVQAWEAIKTICSMVQFSFENSKIILQQFTEFPHENIKRCAFVIGLTKKMEERHHCAEEQTKLESKSSMGTCDVLEKGHAGNNNQANQQNAGKSKEIKWNGEPVGKHLLVRLYINVPQFVEMRLQLEHRKANADADKIDRARAEKRKGKGLLTKYYCKSLYWLERGAFFSLPFDEMDLGYGICHSCKLKETNNKNELFKENASKISLYTKVQYIVLMTSSTLAQLTFLQKGWRDEGSKVGEM
ncbi:DNA (cytosine-5)-methyltransferase [Forsythia ovata]|uniref:DNA (Cytosine-5)-methyltransferase n=1 Tax=Forsythia ovata TaxID=205694 RepID=A0ABD1P3G8_9LAMI